MGFGAYWDFGDSEMKPETDERRGREILEFFVDEYNFKYPSGSISYSEFLSGYGTVGAYLEENIGLNQRVQGMSMSDAKEVMRHLVLMGEGMVPKNWMVYGQTMAKSIENFSWWEAIPFVAIETLKETGELKEGVMATLKSSKYVMPVLIWGGLGLAIYFVAKGLGKSAGSLGDIASMTNRFSKKS